MICYKKKQFSRRKIINNLKKLENEQKILRRISEKIV